MCIRDRYARARISTGKYSVTQPEHGNRFTTEAVTVTLLCSPFFWTNETENTWNFLCYDQMRRTGFFTLCNYLSATTANIFVEIEIFFHVLHHIRITSIISNTYCSSEYVAWKNLSNWYQRRRNWLMSVKCLCPIPFPLNDCVYKGNVQVRVCNSCPEVEFSESCTKGHCSGSYWNEIIFNSHNCMEKMEVQYNKFLKQ